MGCKKFSGVVCFPEIWDGCLVTPLQPTAITSSACGTSVWWEKKTETIQKSLDEGQHRRVASEISSETAHSSNREQTDVDLPDECFPHAPPFSSLFHLYLICVSFSLRQCFKDLGQSQKARKMCEAACSMTATSKEVDFSSMALLWSFASNQLT